MTLIFGSQVCTFHLYDKFVEAARSGDDLRLPKLRDVVSQLPPPNYRFLSSHCDGISTAGLANFLPVDPAESFLSSLFFPSGPQMAARCMLRQATVCNFPLTQILSLSSHPLQGALE